MWPKYVLVTPARNEGRYLTKLIRAVEHQTIPPAQWVIISDNSTDNTYELAREAASRNKAIIPLRLDQPGPRSFSSKALAFAQGYETIRNTRFNYIGNVDADVTFGPRYYEVLVERMQEDSRLGVVSGVLFDTTDQGFRRTISSLNHAVGAVQFWRKECFEAVGGYRGVTVGGMDSLAERTARMKGWQTRSFQDLAVFHHKPVDIAGGRTRVRIAYRAGLTEYHIGTPPLLACLKAIRRWKERPICIAGLVRLYAYLSCWLSQCRRDASDELVAYLQVEQRNEIRARLKRTFGLR